MVCWLNLYGEPDVRCTSTTPNYSSNIICVASNTAHLFPLNSSHIGICRGVCTCKQVTKYPTQFNTDSVGWCCAYCSWCGRVKRHVRVVCGERVRMHVGESRGSSCAKTYRSPDIVPAHRVRFSHTHIFISIASPNLRERKKD